MFQSESDQLPSSFERTEKREEAVKREDHSGSSESQQQENRNKSNEINMFTKFGSIKQEKASNKISQCEKYQWSLQPNKKDPKIKEQQQQNAAKEQKMKSESHQIKVENEPNTETKKKLQMDEGINDDEYMKKVNIEGYGQIHFHKSFNPYPIQINFIKCVLKAIIAKGNALLESPTGTGKTLCLLASTLSWLDQHSKLNESSEKKEKIKIIYLSRTHSQLTQVQKQLNKTDFQPSIVIFGSRDHLCIQDELNSVYGEEKNRECIAAVRRHKKQQEDDIQNKQSKKKTVKCSLKSKLENNLKQFKKDFYKRQYDLQELRQEARGNFCPFYLTQAIRTDADLAFMPYNYLLNEDLVEQYSDIIQGNVIIIDEAHNISGAACQGKQFKICKYEIEQLKKELNKFFAEDKSKQVHTLSKQFQYELLLVYNYLTRVQQFFNRFTIERQQRNQFKESYEIFSEDKLIQCFRFCFCYENDQQQKLLKALDQLILAFNSTWDLEARYLRIFCTFVKKCSKLWLNYKQQSRLPLTSWGDIDLNHFRLIIEIKYLPKYKKFDYKAKMVCLSPHLAFRTLQSLKPRSIIITSGTLSKIEYWEKQLRVPFSQQLTNQAIAPSDQAPMAIITAGPRGQTLNFSYNDRGNENMWLDFYWTISYLIDQIPNGVIVLFSSSTVMSIFLQFIQQKCPSYFDALNNKKKIFIERKKQKNFGERQNSDSDEDNLNGRGSISKKKQDNMNEQLRNFKQEAKTKKGAMLFCYCRGNFSEGLDFADEECRGVIAVGIPKGYWPDKGIQQKISYLTGIKNKNFLERTKYQDGSEWYNISAVRAVNQGIGRVIRHKFDYGRIFLIAQEYTKNEIFNYLSKWARRNCSVVESFEQLRNMNIRQSYDEMQRLTNERRANR